MDEFYEEVRKVLSGEKTLTFEKLSELLDDLIRYTDSFEDMVENLFKMVLSRADYDDSQEMGSIFWTLFRIIRHYGAREGVRALDLLAEQKLSFTELRYYDGSKTNLRDYILDVSFDPEILEKLHQLGVDLNEALIDGRTPARIFASEKYPERPAEVLEYFSVESMEALDNKGTSAIHCAVRYNRYEMLEAMIKKGVNVNITEDRPGVAGTTPLHTACTYGFPKIVQLLMDAGADDTLKNVNEQTPAHIAVTEMEVLPPKKVPVEDRVEMIKALKNIDIPGKEGRTPLMLAQHRSISGTSQLTPVFIEKGADVNRRDDYGNNALMLHGYTACYPDVVKAMISAGVDVNARNQYGDTILHIALELRQGEAARLLIKNGADYNIANEKQLTPMQIAAQEGLEEVLELMV